MTLSWTSYTHAHLPYFIEQVPVPTDSEVYIRLADAPRSALTQVHYDPTPRTYHQVTIDGLEPGRSYYFEARSDGVRAVPNLISTSIIDPMTRDGVFTTLTPPPGEYVQTVVVLNDTHVGLGEHLVKGTGETPYSYFVLEDSLKEIAALAPSAVVINGDVTSEGRPHELRVARRLLDAYGKEKQDYFLTRGNHDRPHRGSEDPRANYESGTVLAPELARGTAETSSAKYAADPFYDNVNDFFDLPYQQMWATRKGNLRLIGLDSADANNPAGGTMHDEQLAAFEAELQSDPHLPTICFTHHPLTRQQALTAFGSRPFLLDKRSATRVEELEAAVPGVFAHYSGHTHRGRRSKGHIATNVDFIEAPASGEYPDTYTVVKFYTGGFTQTTHRPDTERVRGRMVPERWSSHGVLPEGTLYRTDHRNFTVVRDLSALA
ncbi:hypothetical protein GCM10027157_04330 [Corynebacterium aquatimens]